VRTPPLNSFDLSLLWCGFCHLTVPTWPSWRSPERWPRTLTQNADPERWPRTLTHGAFVSWPNQRWVTETLINTVSVCHISKVEHFATQENPQNMGAGFVYIVGVEVWNKHYHSPCSFCRQQPHNFNSFPQCHSREPSMGPGYFLRTLFSFALADTFFYIKDYP
jgi:hypothetical protein